MVSPINNNNNNKRVFVTFQEKSRTKNFIAEFNRRRYPVNEEPDMADKIKIAAGAMIGTLIPMIFFAKLQKGSIKNVSDIFKIKYELKEMLAVSAGSVLGGVGAGLIFDKSTSKKKKRDEGVFQFMNAAVPPVVAAGLLKITEFFPKLNRSSVRIGAVLGGIVAGVISASKLANFINDPEDKYKDRKLTVKDSLVNVDDALGALVIAKLPFVKAFEKFLPAIYAWCGYRAGESN